MEGGARCDRRGPVGPRPRRRGPRSRARGDGVRRSPPVRRGYPPILPGGVLVALAIATLLCGWVARRLAPGCGHGLAAPGIRRHHPLRDHHDAHPRGAGRRGAPPSGIQTCDLSRVGPAPIGVYLHFDDPILNVLMFIPLGLLIGLLDPRQHRRGLLIAAVLLPFAIEATQAVAVPLGRACPGGDVFDNLAGLALGLVIGAAFHRGVRSVAPALTVSDLVADPASPTRRLVPPPPIHSLLGEPGCADTHPRSRPGQCRGRQTRGQPRRGAVLRPRPHAMRDGSTPSPLSAALLSGRPFPQRIPLPPGFAARTATLSQQTHPESSARARPVPQRKPVPRPGYPASPSSSSRRPGGRGDGRTPRSVDRREPPDSAQLEPRRIVDIWEALRLVKATDCKQSALSAQHRARGNAVPLEQQLDGLGRSLVLVPAELAQFGRRRRVSPAGSVSAARPHESTTSGSRIQGVASRACPAARNHLLREWRHTPHAPFGVPGCTRPPDRDPAVALRDIANSCVRELIDDLSVPSVEPSSMTICSQRGSVWASTLSRHRPI